MRLGVPTEKQFYRYLMRTSILSKLTLRTTSVFISPPWNKLAFPGIRFRSDGSSVETQELLLPAVCLAWTTDNLNASPYQSLAVYRILRRDGLFQMAWRWSLRLRVWQITSGHKPPALHQTWATEASKFRVSGLGLLLHGHRHRRLLPLHSRPQASEGYDIRLLHRSGPGG